MTAESTAVCSQPAAEGAGRRSRGAQRVGRPLPARLLVDDYAQYAQTCRDAASGIIRASGPKSPDSHRVVWGLISRPPGSPAGFPPVSRLPAGFFRLRPPSSGFPSSGVLRFVPFGRYPVPVLLRFPSGFPFPWAIFRLALPRGGSAGVGPGRQGPRSPVLPRPPRRDRATRPHYRWAAAGHDGMPPQNRPLRAAASAGHRRARTRPDRRFVFTLRSRSVTASRPSSLGGCGPVRVATAAARRSYR